MKFFPNNWPHPQFMSVDDRGALIIEWIFGKQGAENSWRVLFCWDPKEGAMCCKTIKSGEQVCVENEYAAKYLDSIFQDLNAKLTLIK